MGVFLQPDPIGFKGDAANIYRFCNNNAVNRIDPMGLDDLNYVPTWDITTWNGAETNSIKRGKITVAAHGMVTEMANSTLSRPICAALRTNQIFNLPEGMRLSVKQLVNETKLKDKYTATIPIQLNICHAGDIKGARAYGPPAQAQQVADAFGTNPVIANTGYVNSSTNEGTGDWYRFSKDNAPVLIPTDSRHSAPSIGLLGLVGQGGDKSYDQRWDSNGGTGNWQADQFSKYNAADWCANT